MNRATHRLQPSDSFALRSEPTASLDGDTGRKILEFVKNEVLNESRSIVVVTHDDRIYEFADRILHMEDGRLVDGKGAADA